VVEPGAAGRRGDGRIRPVEVPDLEAGLSPLPEALDDLVTQ